MFSDSERKMNSEKERTLKVKVKVYFLMKNVTFVHELHTVCQ